MQAMTGAGTGAVFHEEKRIPRGRVWTGWGMSGLIAAFFALDAAMKFVKPAQVAAAFVRTGWPLGLSVTLGVILSISCVLYLISRTSVLGAILLTGYLGGAVATNLRLEEPLFSHTLFPCISGYCCGSRWHCGMRGSQN